MNRHPAVRPSRPIGRLYFVVSLPAELDGIAVAGSVNGAYEAIEGEFANGGARRPYRVA